MVDITVAKLFSGEWCSKMADRVKEFVYPEESKETVDVINLLLIGWILLGLVVYILGNVIATQIRKRKAKDFVESAESPAGTETSVKQTSEFVSTSVPKAEEFLENLKYEQVQAPVCVGEESDIVEWANNVFAWIYNQRIVSPILDAWLSGLNARTRHLSTEHGILVDFQNVVHNNQAPTLTDAFETVGYRGVVNISCEAEIRKLVFEVLVTQVKEKDKNVFKFLLYLHRLSGQLTIGCAPEDLAFIAQFSESPQIELDVEPDSTTPIPTEESDALRGLICEIASEAFSSSAIDLRFSSSSECPKFAKSEEESNDEKFELAESDKEEKKLLVKVIKASNIGGSRGSSKPYCVIEMDEPAQRFETPVAEDGANPFWDASFVFTFNTISADLLFELYDKEKPSNDNFLGLCILSLSELMRNPSQRQIIPLQPRPLEKDDVSGTLTTEFLFLDRKVPAADVTQLGTQPSIKSEVDIQPGKTIETNSRVTAGGTIITTTTIKRTAEGPMNNEKPPEPVETAQDTVHTGVSHDISQSRKKFLEQLIEDSSPDLLTINHIDKCTSQKTNDSLLTELKPKTDNHILSEVNSCVNNDDEKLVDDIVPGTVADEAKNGEPDKIFDSCSSDNTEKQNVTKPNSLHVVECNGNVHTENLHDEEKHDSVTCENSIKENMHDQFEDVTKFEFNLPCIVEETTEISTSAAEVTAVNNENVDTQDLTDTALKELEKQGKPTAPDKSTLIIHSVQRMDTSGTDSLEASPASHLSAASRSSHQTSLPPSPSIQRNGVDRSRPKEKKSLIGNLRKKLSFRKTRSKSMELRPGSSASREGNSTAPTERAKSSLNIRETSSVKSGRRFLALPGSTRSSFSEASGVSTTSSRTYINENSTLVIEINENGIIKRYLIPSSMVHRSKWKKKGVKLHLYNDHVFVAKHLTGSTLCQVCKKHLTRRPGKQGYECRDCSIQCHKSCHVKVAEYCPNSSVTSMEVEYIHDPSLTAPKSA